MNLSIFLLFDTKQKEMAKDVKGELSPKGMNKVKEFLTPRPKYEKLLLSLFSMTHNIPSSSLSYLGTYVVVKDDSSEGRSLIHWIEVALMILNEINRGDEDVEEFGHTMMQSLLGDYDDETLYPEQLLIKIYNKLPDSEKIE